MTTPLTDEESANVHMTQYRDKAFAVVQKTCCDSVCVFENGCGCADAIETALVAAFNDGVADNVAAVALKDRLLVINDKLEKAAIFAVKRAEKAEADSERLKEALTWAISKLSFPSERSTDASGPYDYCIQYDKAKAAITPVAEKV